MPILGWLLSLASATTVVPPIAADDSAQAAACAPLRRAAAEHPETAADVRTTLTLHGGAVRWMPAAGPIRVWVQPRRASTVSWDHATAEWRDAVLSAAAAWRGVVAGLEFRPARDSSSADVRVTWAGPIGTPATAGPELASGTAGRTALHDENGQARSAHVRLAVADRSGALYAVSDVRAVARHEFGHVLGLAHHAATNSVMAALIRVDRLHPGDRAALRLLYALPTGARCAAAGRGA